MSDNQCTIVCCKCGMICQGVDAITNKCHESAQPKEVADTILDEAKRLVHGPRNESYAHPLDDFTCSTTMFRAFLKKKYDMDVPIVAEDGIAFMNFVKWSREATRENRDNRVDGSGYWECLDMTVEERKRRAMQSEDKKPC